MSRSLLLHALPPALVVAICFCATAVAASVPAKTAPAATTTPARTTTSTAKSKQPRTPKTGTGSKSRKRTAKKKRTTTKPAVVTRGLTTILQDDSSFLYSPAASVQNAAARAKQLGVDTIRLTASWSSLTRGADQKTKPAGFDARDPAAYEQARWTALDTAVRAVHSAGMQVLIDIGFWAPEWATTDSGPRARTNIDPQAFADFAAAVALRYSGGFTPPPEPPAAPQPAPSEDQSLLQSILQPLVPFPLPDPFPPTKQPPPGASAGRDVQAADGGATGPGEPLPNVSQFVLWNEPNHQGLLLPQWEADGTTPASPRIYRAMVRAGYAAVKSVRGKVTVLIGNTSSTGGKRGVGPVPPLEFLRDLACVDAHLHPLTTPDCAGYTMLPGDGWAHHPYSQNERPSRTSKPATEPGDLRMADLPQLATTLDALVKMGRISPADANIYITEFGYETQPVKGRPTIGELTQARWLTWAEYLADRIPTVRSFAQFLLRDQPPAPVRVSASAARPFGQYSTGLLTADGKDKIAAKTFDAGLFTQKRSNGRVLIYGRLRLGPAIKTITVQRRRPRHAWGTIEKLKIDGRSSFTQTIAHVPGSLYRLGYPTATGARTTSIAIRPVPASTAAAKPVKG